MELREVHRLRFFPFFLNFKASYHFESFFWLLITVPLQLYRQKTVEDTGRGPNKASVEQQSVISTAARPIRGVEMVQLSHGQD